MTSLSTKAKVTVAIVGVAVVAGLWRIGSRSVSRPGPDKSAVNERRQQIERRLAEIGRRRNAEYANDWGDAQQQAMHVPSNPSSHRRAEAAKPAVDESGFSADDRADFDRLKRIVFTASDPEDRMKALWEITKYDDAPVAAVLQQALFDPDREVRLAAVQELSSLDEQPPLDIVAMAMDDPDPEIRLEALNLVDDLADDEGQAESVRPLVDKALNDPDEDVRSRAEDIRDLDFDSDAGPQS
jgi:hypothetical protein